MTESDPQIDVDSIPTPDGADRLSAILLAIATAQDRERISIGDLLHALEHRALAALMFVFAVPNVIPVPPGVSAVLGAPLLFLTAQLMLGRHAWLPRFITDRSLARVDFEKVVVRAAPWLEKAERLMRPRAEFLGKPPVVYLVGALCLFLAIILFLPIPLGNMLPALAICILSLGVLERDGLWIGIGSAVGIASIVIVWGVLWAVIFGAFYVLNNWLGIGV